MYVRNGFSKSAGLCMCDSDPESTITSKHVCASAYGMLGGDASKRFDAIVDKRAVDHDGVLVSTNFDHTTCMI